MARATHPKTRGEETIPAAVRTRRERGPRGRLRPFTDPHEILSKHTTLMVYAGLSAEALAAVINLGLATYTLVHAIYLTIKG
jgi:hypothetical protein